MVVVKPLGDFRFRIAAPVRLAQQKVSQTTKANAKFAFARPRQPNDRVLQSHSEHESVRRPFSGEALQPKLRVVSSAPVLPQIVPRRVAANPVAEERTNASLLSWLAKSIKDLLSCREDAPEPHRLHKTPLKRHNGRERNEEASLTAMARACYTDLADVAYMVNNPDQHLDTILIAIDTERRPIRGIRGATQACEIGLTILRLKDVVDVPLNKSLAAWLLRMEHHHFYIQSYGMFAWIKSGSRGQKVRAPWLFRPAHKTSRHVSCAEASRAIRSIWSSLRLGKLCSRIALVGHSVIGDLAAIQMTPRLTLDFERDPLLHVDTIIDSGRLARQASKRGLKFESLSLQDVCRAFGIDAQHVHHAGNDAAYSMMATILLAASFKEPMYINGRIGNVSSNVELAEQKCPARRKSLLRSRPTEKCLRESDIHSVLLF